MFQNKHNPQETVQNGGIPFYLAEWMRVRRVSDKQLANAIEVSVPTIWRWRKGVRRPPDDDIARIAFILDCRPMQLFTPPERPSIDCLLTEVSPDIHRQIYVLVQAIAESVHKLNGS